MKYIDYTAYKNLNSKTQDIKWVIYLPVKHGASETNGNVSLVHNAISLLKNTLKQDGTPHKDSTKIIDSLREKASSFAAPINGESVLFVISKKLNVESYVLPISLEVGYITDMKDLFFKPLVEFFDQKQSYYFLDLHQNGCQLYQWDINGIQRIEDKEIEKSLSAALMLDEAGDRNIQTHHLSALNDGMQDGVHGQGGFKDKHKAYVIQYLRFIDKQLAKYNQAALQPIILSGSKQLSHAFKKISHNKHQIKGYMTNLPKSFDLKLMKTQLIEY